MQAAFADLFLGLPSAGADKQGKRRELYGKAGRYRPTSYGIEYRVLSNYWLFNEHWTAEIGARALALGKFLLSDEDTIRKAYTEVPWGDVEASINEEDEEAAADVIAYCLHDLKIKEIAA